MVARTVGTRERDATRQNSHLTHRANTGVGRHGWLRLTPAYSVRLVRERTAHLPPGAIVTDPFSGSGTTALAAAEHGGAGQAVDVNPFLVWLGNAKAASYPAAVLDEARSLLAGLADQAARDSSDAAGLWAPNLHNIDRWWSPGSLAGLKALRHRLDQAETRGLPGPARDLLSVAFCRTAIGVSNASFNHQSMSFAAGRGAVPDGEPGSEHVIGRFRAEAAEILACAATGLPGSGRVVLGDARDLGAAGLPRCDLLLTSPPYVNRMSYIRELRPYMYWLRFLDQASDAGELDWTAIGGTWGIATSRLHDWSANRPPLASPVAAIEGELRAVTALIARDGGKHGPLLATYVTKYFHDMAAHFTAAFEHVRSGGTASYIVGNSTFYRHVVPAERWYAALLTAAGFTGVRTTVIRKRNSNLALYEYEVSAQRP
ncbi:MAG TPA: hypothetical protein VN847_08895 [Streptosporangiaceae bacterium]|nr:hypothetical protein [Streptosporangiaceae bacterium]